MEPPEFYDAYLDDDLRDRLGSLLGRRDDRRTAAYFAQVRGKQADPEFRARDADEVMLRKGFEAPGAYIAADRPAALDHLGFASQLVFTTSLLGPLTIAEHRDDVD